MIPARRWRNTLVQPPPSAEPRPVSQRDFAALDALPVGLALVDYEPTSDPGAAPGNVWANREYLRTMGCSLQDWQEHAPVPTDREASSWQHLHSEVQERGNTISERAFLNTYHDDKILAEVQYAQCTFVDEADTNSTGRIVTMLSVWPLDVKDPKVKETTLQAALLEASPYPLCFFRMDGHLITCNPAARRSFGSTIWLQSDIFGMGPRERRGLNMEELPSMHGSFRIDRTERRTAYESMIHALAQTGRYEVDLPVRAPQNDDSEDKMYCRVLAHRQTDPTSGDNIVMISHQDVTALRLVEGELGRLQMQEETNKGLMQQDSDVAGSLLTLLGEPDHGLTEASSRRTASFEVDGSGDPSSPLLERMDSSGDLSTAEGKDEVERQSGLSKKLDALLRVLAKAGDWQFDVFELQLEAQGQPLQVLAWHVLWTHGLIDEFNLDHFKLIKFLKQVEIGHQDNPYHNATHVADVVQSMHVLLLKGGLAKQLTRLHVLAAILAACVHDLEHRGFNNDFLIKTQDNWAIDSNDRSPNESHHVSAAFRILRNPECNFLQAMDISDQRNLRRLMIEMVLATDMAEHMAIVSQLKTELQRQNEKPDDVDKTHETSEEARTLFLRSAIKVADIGHLYAALPVHIEWSQRLEEEMWKQGDVEMELGMPVSFLMDRDKPGVTKSQPGFINFVVMPLFQTWVETFPESKELLLHLNANKAYWLSKEAEAAKAGGSRA